jgi:hypothetical protein
MGRIENALNRLNDLDGCWWPLLALRPPREWDIGPGVLVRLTLLFGPAAGLAALLLLGACHRLPSARGALGVLLAAVLGFLLVFKFTFALAWNRRAERLRGQGGRGRNDGTRAGEAGRN